jgi:uncharacterized cupredoxin-like copper-binding protein
MEFLEFRAGRLRRGRHFRLVPRRAMANHAPGLPAPMAGGPDGGQDHKEAGGFMKVVRLAALAAVLALSARPGLAAEDYVTNAADIVKAADWKKMTTVTVKMGEQGDKLYYEPEKLVFKAGQPYKLEMKNTGRKKHYFAAPEFFRMIAMRKIQSNRDGEVKAPYITAVEIYEKEGQMDLYFVPVKKGSFEVKCSIDDHADRGMYGTIVVE